MTFYIFFKKFNQFNLLNLFLLVLIFKKFEFSYSKHYSQPLANYQTKFKDESPSVNWTRNYDAELANFALDFAAAAYSLDPTPCLEKHNATLEKLAKLPCDYVNNKCWAFIARTNDWIILSIRGTQTRIQLITELIETMSAPKRKFPGGGSVHRYFYTAVQAIWNNGFSMKLRELKIKYPNTRLLFTGHSLGGALSSLASTLFAVENNDIENFNSKRDIQLITFGQPRVGNMDNAYFHDIQIPNSWRIIHRYDIVAHLPYCVERIFSHRCTSLYNHGSFHHGTEIWYPGEMNLTNSVFRICTGLPINEDDNCSNSYYVHYDIDDHLIYFGKDIDFYGNSGCRADSTLPRLPMPSASFFSYDSEENQTKHWPKRKRSKKRS